MGEFSKTIISIFRRAEAASQGGLLTGTDPTSFDTGDPLRIWVIQLGSYNLGAFHASVELSYAATGVIIGMSSFLSLLLRKMRQPKVISEVLGGILLGAAHNPAPHPILDTNISLLGPTAFGRIPGFTEHVFPSDSIPYLSLVANIGLCLFLFLVGLEIDMTVIRRNAKLSGTIALAGMVLPFGFGAGLSVGIGLCKVIRILTVVSRYPSISSLSITPIAV